MGNMSYCRFQNTLGDLRDCQEALEGLDPDASEKLSKEELRAAKALAGQAVRMLTFLANVAEVEVDLDELTKKLPEIMDELNGEGGPH